MCGEILSCLFQSIFTTAAFPAGSSQFPARVWVLTCGESPLLCVKNLFSTGGWCKYSYLFVWIENAIKRYEGTMVVAAVVEGIGFDTAYIFFSRRLANITTGQPDKE